MKSFIKKILLLGIIIMLASCSTGKGEGETGGGGGRKDFLSTGDSVIDKGIVDALTQGNNPIPIIEMTQWQAQFVQIDNEYDLTNKNIKNLFISSDNNNYTKVGVASVNGKEEYGSDIVEFNNEVERKSLQEGTLTKIENFKLFDKDSTSQIDKQGYTILYTYTPTKITDWLSGKHPDGSGVWEDTGSDFLIAEYYIVKESATELSVIKVTEKGLNNDEYKLTYHSSIADAINDELSLTVYKKKQ